MNTPSTTMKHLLNALIALAAGLAAQQAIAQGTLYHVGFLQNYQGGGQQELALFIASEVATSGTVQQPQTGLLIPFTVTPGITTTVVIPDILQHTTSEQVENKGLVVQSLETITVQALNFEGYTADGTNVLPSDALGFEYLVMAYQGFDGIADLKSELVVVATADDTEVSITPSVGTEGGNAANVPFTVMLDANQSIQVKAANEFLDLTGTRIVATTNGSCGGIAVFAGARCTKVPTTCTACDHLYEQMIPVERWGMEHYTVAFEGPTGYSVRILAAEDSTEVEFQGGIFMLDAGEWTEQNGVTSSVTVFSTKPVCVAQYMEGVTCAAVGDPSLLIVNAADQGVEHATFSTVVSTVITDHRVGISTDAANAGLLTLDGFPLPSNLFIPYTLQPGRVHCDLGVSTGSHTIDAPLPFVAHLYGMGSAESYAQGIGVRIAPTLSADTVICHAGGSITLDAPGTFTNPYWYAVGAPLDTLAVGMQFALIAINDTTVAVSNNSTIECVDVLHFHIELPLQGILDLSTTQGSVCMHQPAMLNAQMLPPAPLGAIWSPAGLIPDPYQVQTAAYPLQDQWFTATATTPGGCWPVQDSVFVQVQPNTLTAAHAQAATDSICLGSSVQLAAIVERALAVDAFNGSLAAWWSGAYGGGIGNGCQPLSGQALVFDAQGPRGVVSGPLDLSGSARVRFSLIVGDGLNGCEDADIGENIFLEYSVNGGGIWYQAMLLPENGYPDWLFVEVPLPSQAIVQDVLLRWRQQGTFLAGEDVWALDNVVVITESTLGMIYDWQPAAWLNDNALASPIATPPVAGTITLLITDSLGACNASDSVLIDIGQPITVTLPGDTILCGSQTFTVSADSIVPGWNYNWIITNGQATSYITPSTTVTMTAGGQLVLQATDVFGCIDRDTMVVVVANSPDAFTIGQLGNTLCGGPFGPWIYQWYFNNLPIAGANAQCYDMLQSGLYTLEVDAGNGCSASASGTFTYTAVEEWIRPPFTVHVTNGGVYVQTNRSFDSLRLITTTGQVVAEHGGPLYAGERVMLHVGAAGVYLLQAITADGSFAARVCVP